MSRTAYDNLPEDDGFDYDQIEGGEPQGTDLIRYTTDIQGGVRLFSIRPILLLAMLALAVVALTVGVVIWRANVQSSERSLSAYPIPGAAGGLQTGPRVGALAPDFELTDINTGQPVKLSSLRGRPVWLNYFATWCPPCKAELPDMKQKYAKYKERGLVLVGLNMREDPSDVKAFTSKNGYDWTFVVDADGKVTDRYFVYSIPTHLFIDKNGIIRAVGIGGLTPSAMEANIATIIGP